MITFFRRENCPACGAIEETLAELCIRHEITLVDREGHGDRSTPEGTRPPVLLDEGQVYQGSGAILAHLDELAEFRAVWEKFQTDACYCDDEGNVE
jgi:glutaredoxin